MGCLSVRDNHGKSQYCFSLTLSPTVGFEVVGTGWSSIMLSMADEINSSMKGSGREGGPVLGGKSLVSAV
jgi:hypothetical protein